MTGYTVTDDDIVRFVRTYNDSYMSTEAPATARRAAIQAVLDDVLTRHPRPIGEVVELTGWPPMEYQTVYSIASVGRLAAMGWRVHTAQFTPDGTLHALLERDRPTDDPPGAEATLTPDMRPPPTPQATAWLETAEMNSRQPGPDFTNSP